MSNYKTAKDKSLNASTVSTRQLLPIINSNYFPAAIIANIAYDSITRRIYYSDGIQWKPLKVDSSGDQTGFGLIKSGSQTILANTPTTLVSFLNTPQPPYHTVNGWNLTTGIYTSPTDQYSFNIQAVITWDANISTAGKRICRIKYHDVSAVTTITAQEVTTQPNPDITISTTQYLNEVLQVDVGDQVWIEVEHNAPVPVNISTGNKTIISGVLN